MSLRYFTSDLHLNHAFVARTRGFDDVNEYAEHVADRWNDTVSKHDSVWVLGDLTLGKPETVADFIAKLPGIKHLILGNHDVGHPMHRNAHKHQAAYHPAFTSVAAAGRLRLNTPDGTPCEVLLSHFPYDTDDGEADRGETRYSQWRLPDHGTPLLHGHTHMAGQVRHGHQVHVGWDAWGRPVTEKEIVDLLTADG